MAYMTAADGAEVKRRPEAIEAGVNQEKVDAGITKTQVLDALRKLDEDKVLFKDAVEVEIQNCKTQTDLMKNVVGRRDRELQSGGGEGARGLQEDGGPDADGHQDGDREHEGGHR